MTDAEYEALAEKWIDAIGLGWWEIDLVYARDDYEAEPRGDASRSLATCSADWRYGHACITWNMPEVKDTPDAKLETAFVHELMHIFLSEARWIDKDTPKEHDSLDHEERVASTLAKGFLWLRDAIVRDPAAWGHGGAA
jgi:hypothetical protein